MENLIENRSIYKLSDNAIIQRDIRIPLDLPIIDVVGFLIRSQIIANLDDKVMMVCVSPEVMEVNVIGAIIIEEFESGKTMLNVINKLMYVFEKGIELRDLICYIEELTKLKIIVEHQR